MSIISLDYDSTNNDSNAYVNRICTMYNVYSYSRQGENLVLVLKCHEKERKLGRQAMVEIDR